MDRTHPLTPSTPIDALIVVPSLPKHNTKQHSFIHTPFCETKRGGKIYTLIHSFVPSLCHSLTPISLVCLQTAATSRPAFPPAHKRTSATHACVRSNDLIHRPNRTSTDNNNWPSHPISPLPAPTRGQVATTTRPPTPCVLASKRAVSEIPPSTKFPVDIHLVTTLVQRTYTTTLDPTEDHQFPHKSDPQADDLCALCSEYLSLVAVDSKSRLFDLKSTSPPLSSSTTKIHPRRENNYTRCTFIHLFGSVNSSFCFSIPLFI